MDNLTPEQRRLNMQRIHSTGTQAELLLMGELKKRGLSFTTYDKTVIGKPDIVFPERKVAVFVDSDFWHGNPKRFIAPQTNVEYWTRKIERNKKRDRQVNSQLKKEGWHVVRVWDYDVKRRLELCIGKILKTLNIQQPP